MKLSFLNESGKYTIDMEETRFKLADKFIRKANRKLADWLWNKRAISYERYWEIALAGLRVGTQWTDIKGMDNSDGGEVKTITICLNETKSSRTCTVGGLKNKTGTIHIVVYDPFYNDFYFLLIPNKDMKENLVDDGRALRLSFPRKDKPIRGWQKKYMVSFEEWICGK